MVCIGGTCSADSFSVSLLFHLTAKIKAYNQIPLIGPDCGDQPAVSPLALSVLPWFQQHKEWQWVLGNRSACQSRFWASAVTSSCWLTASYYLSVLAPWSCHVPHHLLILPVHETPRWPTGSVLTSPFTRFCFVLRSSLFFFFFFLLLLCSRLNRSRSPRV